MIGIIILIKEANIEKVLMKNVFLVMIISALFGSCLLFFKIAFPSHSAPSLNDMVTLYEINQHSIQKVVDMFQSLEFDNVYTDASDVDYRHIKAYDNMPIKFYAYDDDEVLEAFQILFNKLDCKIICKEKQYIYFQWWATFDEGCGIVFSLDGKTPRMFEEFGVRNELKIEPLGYENWYYYYHRFKHKEEVAGL